MWGPAYVSWCDAGEYAGWCPLDPWDRPCFAGTGDFNAFGITFDDRCWSFCRRNLLFNGRLHPVLTGSERLVVSARDIHLTRDRFQVIRNVYKEIGVPRETVRGLVVNGRGVSARAVAQQVEQTVPEARRKLIDSRFQPPAEGRPTPAAQPGAAARQQRDPQARIGRTDMLKGGEAARRVPAPPVVTERPGTRSPEPEPAAGPSRAAPSPVPRQASPAPAQSPPAGGFSSGPRRAEGGANEGRDLSFRRGLGPGRAMPGRGR